MLSVVVVAAVVVSAVSPVCSGEAEDRYAKALNSLLTETWKRGYAAGWKDCVKKMKADERFH